MAKLTTPSKRLLIDKANSALVIAAGAAAFIFIFCLVASKTLLSQMAYQNRVIHAKQQTLGQLKSDLNAANALQTSYQAFNSTAQNVLGGNPNGNGPQDGNNSKIILDALPSTYDFPALILSIEKLVNVNGATITGITGSDDALTQASNQASGSPQPVEIPFSVTATGSYDVMQKVVGQFEHSIQPMQVQSLSLSGNQSQMSLNLALKTYYQPAKQLNITKQVVR